MLKTLEAYLLPDLQKNLTIADHQQTQINDHHAYGDR